MALAALLLLPLVRYQLVFNARCYWSTLPLLLLLVATPIIFHWDALSHEWSTPKEPTPLFAWLVMSAVYFTIPFTLLIIDTQIASWNRNHIGSRILVDIVAMIIWLEIGVGILVFISHK